MKHVERRLLESLVRSIVTEALSWKALAAATFDSGNMRTAIIYRPSELVKVYNSQDKEAPGDYITGLAEAIDAAKVIVGFIEIAPPNSSEKCANAWQVKYSAGPKYGDLVYGLGFAMTPTGWLMPDRAKGLVSPSATKRWTKISKKAEEAEDEKGEKSHKGKIPLDDPNKPGPFTPDKFDDCERLQRTAAFGGPDPVLDAAYAAEGWEKAELERLKAAHKETFDWIGQDSKEVLEALTTAGDAFFRKTYDAANMV